VVRRVKVRAADISADPRARRRRTIPKVSWSRWDAAHAGKSGRSPADVGRSWRR
jgi:hypothetical protein